MTFDASDDGFIAKILVDANSSGIPVGKVLPFLIGSAVLEVIGCEAHM